MLDFTSSLYLGLWHDSGSLRPWSQLTTGVPAALTSPPGVAEVDANLAQLQNCERAILGPSTFHLFWDLFGLLAGNGAALFLDQGTYPVARWGMTQAVLQGVPLITFPHRNPRALAARVKASPHFKPVVVADGTCTCCGSPLPIDAYLEIIRPLDGLLVLDDTQGLGIWGHSPGRDAPFGRGGGGSLRCKGIGGENIVLVCSLAKAFGAPVAALSSSRFLVDRFEAASQTRVHCSPPSIVAIHAAARAMTINATHGDGLRRRLALSVRLFRERLKNAGLRATGGFFPVQRLPPLPAAIAQDLHTRLLAAGVRTVLQHCNRGNTGRITFILTARHGADAVSQAVNTLATLAQNLPWTQSQHG